MSAKTPQPEVLPCGVCTIAATGRVTGKWQKSECISNPPGEPGANPTAIYPVDNPRIEVIEGDQKGKTFAVATEGELAESTPFEGEVAEGAMPSGWSTAYLWVTDAENRDCYSVLAIDK